VKQAKKLSEFGVIRNARDYPENPKDSFDEIYISDRSFHCMIKFIEENARLDPKIENAFSITRKAGKQNIKVRNFVGVVETREGVSIEILPKIYLSENKEEIVKIKRIFLKMLRYLRNSPFMSISDAHLITKKDYPLLEVFISCYLDETRRLLKSGLKKDYFKEEDNLIYLKGKLKISKHCRINYSNRSRFFVEYDRFNINIPQNRLIKSTLLKLKEISRIYKNISLAADFLGAFSKIPISQNIPDDFSKLPRTNRLFDAYFRLLEWSEVFLMNKSYVNFQGTSINQAILFPMERIFEDYIGFLFRKFSQGIPVKFQDKKYHLVEKHINSPKFRLIPDIVVGDNAKVGIVDVKWKVIDSAALKKNYLISQSDMYQLFAYGKKYADNFQDTTLFLIYPKSNLFKKKLESFYFEKDLKLEVVPFDFEHNEKEQITDILQSMI